MTIRKSEGDGVNTDSVISVTSSHNAHRNKESQQQQQQTSHQKRRRDDRSTISSSTSSRRNSSDASLRLSDRGGGSSFNNGIATASHDDENENYSNQDLTHRRSATISRGSCQRHRQQRKQRHDGASDYPSSNQYYHRHGSSHHRPSGGDDSSKLSHPNLTAFKSSTVQGNNLMTDKIDSKHNITDFNKSHDFHSSTTPSHQLTSIEGGVGRNKCRDRNKVSNNAAWIANDDSAAGHCYLLRTEHPALVNTNYDAINDKSYTSRRRRKHKSQSRTSLDIYSYDDSPLMTENPQWTRQHDNRNRSSTTQLHPHHYATMRMPSSHHRRRSKMARDVSHHIRQMEVDSKTSSSVANLVDVRDDVGNVSWHINDEKEKPILFEYKTNDSILDTSTNKIDNEYSNVYTNVQLTSVEEPQRHQYYVDQSYFVNSEDFDAKHRHGVGSTRARSRNQSTSRKQRVSRSTDRDLNQPTTPSCGASTKRTDHALTIDDMLTMNDHHETDQNDGVMMGNEAAVEITPTFQHQFTMNSQFQGQHDGRVSCSATSVPSKQHTTNLNLMNQYVHPSAIGITPVQYNMEHVHTTAIHGQMLHQITHRDNSGRESDPSSAYGDESWMTLQPHHQKFSNVHAEDVRVRKGYEYAHDDTLHTENTTINGDDGESMNKHNIQYMIGQGIPYSNKFPPPPSMFMNSGEVVHQAALAPETNLPSYYFYHVDFSSSGSQQDEINATQQRLIPTDPFHHGTGVVSAGIPSYPPPPYHLHNNQVMETEEYGCTAETDTRYVENTHHHDIPTVGTGRSVIGNTTTTCDLGERKQSSHARKVGSNKPHPIVKECGVVVSDETTSKLVTTAAVILPQQSSRKFGGAGYDPTRDQQQHDEIDIDKDSNKCLILLINILSCTTLLTAIFSIWTFITSVSLNFFCLDPESEEQKRNEWQVRRRRLAIKRFGGVRDEELQESEGGRCSNLSTSFSNSQTRNGHITSEYDRSKQKMVLKINKPPRHKQSFSKLMSQAMNWVCQKFIKNIQEHRTSKLETNRERSRSFQPSLTGIAAYYSTERTAGLALCPPPPLPRPTSSGSTSNLMMVNSSNMSSTNFDVTSDELFFTRQNSRSGLHHLNQSSSHRSCGYRNETNYSTGSNQSVICRGNGSSSSSWQMNNRRTSPTCMANDASGTCNTSNRHYRYNTPVTGRGFAIRNQPTHHSHHHHHLHHHPPSPPDSSGVLRMSSDVGVSRIWSKLLDAAFDNSDRRKHGLAVVRRKLVDWRRQRVMHRKPESNRKKILGGNCEDYRPFFTYWMMFVQIVVLILSVAIHGPGPFGLDVHRKTGMILVTTLELEHVSYSQSANFWFGPSTAALIQLGAKYAPCMHFDDSIDREIRRERIQERDSACCIREDRAGCVQMPKSECVSSSTLNSGDYNPKQSNRKKFEWERVSKWYSNYPSNNGRSSGPVCGLDPAYCESPASVAPYIWPDDITKWPICRRRKTSATTSHPSSTLLRLAGRPLINYKNGPSTATNQLFKPAAELNTAEHMVCEVIGHPCCIGTRGQCKMTTSEHCAFVGGVFHEEAALCSQISCLEDVCGLLPFKDRDNPNQLYRIWISQFIHAGCLHLAVTLTIQHWLMRDLEKMMGSIRMMIIYTGSGVIGNLASAIFVPYRADVGPSGAYLGLLACAMVEICHQWNTLKFAGMALLRITGLVALFITLGLLPWIDNYAHVFGFMAGFLLSYALLPFITFAQFYQRKKKVVLLLTSLGGTAFLLISLTLIFHLSPVYDCEICKYFTCIPITRDFCVEHSAMIQDDANMRAEAVA